MRLYDIEFSKAQALAEECGSSFFDSMPRAVVGADLVILCTPIKETPSVIGEVVPHMKEGSILCEIASLKRRTSAELKITLGRRIQPLSIHPMFGPDIGKIDGQTIVVVPILDQEKETSLTREIFPKTETIALDADTHDSFMATILSLPYFMNLVFAKSLPLKDLSLLRRLAGTTFAVQLAVAQSIVGESPELIWSLINENVFSKDSINRFIDESRFIRRLLKKEHGEIEKFLDTLQAEMIKDPEEVKARTIRNEFFKALRANKGQF